MEQTKLDKVPKFSDLVRAMSKDPQEAFKNDAWNSLLNMPPHQDWIKIHPMTKTQYLPIDKVEYLLLYIYGKYRVEVLTVQPLFNSTQVTIRLHVLNPISLEWEWNDGIGATPVQVEKNGAAADLGSIKSNAVQIGAPSAESFAVKDAAEKFGKIFGRDLNRKDTVMFSGGYSEQQPTQPQQPTPKQAAPAAPKPTPAPVFKDDNPYAATNGHTNNQPSSFNLSAL